MDSVEFRNLIVREFPQLENDLHDWDGLLHLQMMEFLRLTQEAINTQSFDTVSKCFAIAKDALSSGDDAVRNALYVSFLEDLDLRSDAGRRAFELMPTELRKGRDEILDYDERLLGRKWPTDDRE